MNGALKQFGAASQKAAAQRVSFKVLVQLARGWMANGVVAPEIKELSDQAFVKAACDALVANGEEPTHSRIALRTGIERKRVGRLLTLLYEGDDPHVVSARNAAKDVLAAWYFDPEFLTDDGEPLPLPRQGQGRTFTDLVRKYAGDHPASAVLGELIDYDVVSVDRGFILPRRRDYIPSPASVEQLRIGAETIADLIQSINYNTHEARTSDEGLYQRRATEQIDESQVPEARQFIKETLEQSLTIIYAYLQSRRAEHVQGKGTKRLGVGVFQILDE